MIIHFNGAAQTVTGSQFLLELNGQRLLLECGLFQGKRKETYRRNQKFAFDPQKVDAAIISHAHIDHSGNLPNLVKQRYEGPIYATPGTTRLADLMLQDSGHIHESDTSYINKRRIRDGKSPREPLYTVADAVKVAEHFRPIPYDQTFEPVKGVTAHLVDAGHILGSASVVLDINDDGRNYRLWFSGDIGRIDLPLLEDPTLPEDTDYLIMECTYGNRLHHYPEEAYNKFRDVVVRTVNRGGKVIIPAFAVGRTQELVYNLNRLIAEGEIPSIPVYVDSPLAVNVTEVFREFREYFDDETRQFIRTAKSLPLSFANLTYTSSVEESKAINDRHEPMVIISAAGMAQAGRILHHIRNNIGDPRNTIMIVSWQAPYTLGRRLVDRERKIKIFGENHKVKAEIATINGFSAHADRNMLLKYARSSKGRLKQIFLVHGEPRSAEPLMEMINIEQIASVSFPSPFESVEI